MVAWWSQQGNHNKVVIAAGGHHNVLLFPTIHGVEPFVAQVTGPTLRNRNLIVNRTEPSLCLLSDGLQA